MLKFNVGSVVRLFYKYQMDDIPRTGKIVEVTKDTISLMPQRAVEVYRKDKYESELLSVDVYYYPIVLERSAIGGWTFIHAFNNVEQGTFKVNERDFESFLKEDSSIITRYNDDGFCLGESEDNK